MIHETLVPGHEYTVLSLSPISAWALFYGGKDVESQPCSTSVRGRVLIHASSQGISLRESQARRAELSFLSGLAPSALPTIFTRSALLGSIEILDCVRDARSKWAVPGKYHWVLSEPRPLREAIVDIEGALQFFSWIVPEPARTSRRPERVPARSGIVPAVRMPGESPRRASTPAPLVSRKRG